MLGGSKHFVEVAPDFFREAGRQDKLLFRRGPRGRVTKAIFSEIPEYTYERLAWWERPAFNQALLGACSAVFGTTLMVAAASQVFGRLRRAGSVETGFGRIARWTAVSMAVVELRFVAGLFAVFGDLTLYAGRLGRLRALLVLPLLGTVLTGGVLICMVLAWWRGLWSLPARFHYTAAALAGLALKWFQATWNLLGFRL